MSVIVSPSMLSCDFANVQRDVEMINRSEADWFHIDIMDGVFVPNISFGLPVLKAMKKYATKPMDVHLMIVEPDKYVADFKEAGADLLTVHYEACPHLHRSIQLIKSHDMQAGVALNPHTNPELLRSVIRDLDLVLIMSVNPGFGGQKFIDQAVEKVAELKKMIVETGSSAKIEIDGGVNLETGRRLVDAGADALVAGSFVFKSEDPEKTIAALKQL
ncbi:MAG: ribulose-phosphate 3-epimerase [Fluviicola sp. XM-24bin1]|nr:MAG: ribulose-phosphate 3-epimerase [Fluviicola sp. XM-24bin1]